MRLIDADALEKRIKEWYCSPERCDNYNGVRCRACYWDDALNMIDEAPTITQEPMEMTPEEAHAKLEKYGIPRYYLYGSGVRTAEWQ